MSKKLNIIRTLTLLFAVLLCFSGCERINMPIAPEIDRLAVEPLTVMTYNVYMGSSALSVLSVENLLQVPTEVANFYNTFMASDFPGRATAIAKSIKAHQPHLIGLQEMVLIRQQIPGDRIAGGSLPAEEVVMDFRVVLRNALKAEGLDYRIAAEIENVDVEMPMFTDDGSVDVRLTDYDVILARRDVETSDAMNANFSNAVKIDRFGLEVRRGYTSVAARVAGVTYRFVNTHLEAFSETVRVAQTHELIDSLSDETLPIILLGDFNTPAPDGTAYQLLIDAEYVDTWQTDAPGKTCCQHSDIRNAESLHQERIDLIFVCNAESDVSVLMTQTLGDTPADRLASGLWPSDHAGVVAVVVF